MILFLQVMMKNAGPATGFCSLLIDGIPAGHTGVFSQLHSSDTNSTTWKFIPRPNRNFLEMADEELGFLQELFRIIRKTTDESLRDSSRFFPLFYCVPTKHQW